MKSFAQFRLVVALLCGTVNSAWAFPGPTEGVVGVVLWAFLAYCALIVIAQLLAALYTLRRIIGGSTGKKKISRQVMLR